MQREVSFGEAVNRGLNNYCNFSGRASRSEFWWFQLFMLIVSCAAGVVGAILGKYGTWIPSAVGLALLLPSFGLMFRRLHDIGKSGWWWLLVFIPLVGGIILIVWYCKESEPVANEYGPVPNETY